jgi:hypothetical protein
LLLKFSHFNDSFVTLILGYLFFTAFTTVFFDNSKDSSHQEGAFLKPLTLDNAFLALPMVSIGKWSLLSFTFGFLLSKIAVGRFLTFAFEFTVLPLFFFPFF